MKDQFIKTVLKLMGVKPLQVERIPLEEVLRGRNLEEDVQELDLATLKALFRWTGKELRKRL
jgi:hypothetical protein